MKDDMLGIIIIVAILGAALFGGFKTAQNNTLLPENKAPQTEEQKQADVQHRIDELKIQLKETQDAEVASVYKGIVHLNYVNRSDNPSNEYVSLQADSQATTSVPITGWTIKSLSTGNSVTIPKAVGLYFSNSLNTEDPIVLLPKDSMYIVTGTSPTGFSFRLNKCSGYLEQFQTFVPYIPMDCPAPRNEDLSSIPKRVENDNCFDYIDSLSSCRIQTDPLPAGFSSECKNFVTTKINYASCVDIHKNDSDFYKNEWRVYLRRSTPLWKNRRESIVLYDSVGKIVDTITY